LALPFSVVDKAKAELITFFGEDLKTDGDDGTRLASTPNANAAHDAFLGLLISPGTEDFEGFNEGNNPTTLTFGPETGAVVNASSDIKVKDVPTGTFGGTYPMSGDNLLLHFMDAAFDIEFTNPQVAFGFYGTDIGDGDGQLSVALHHTSGGTTNLAVPHATAASTGQGLTGSALYFGVVSTVNPFDSVTINNANASLDGFGYDDMTAAASTTIPEPSSFILLCLSLLGMFGYVWCRHRLRLALAEEGRVREQIDQTR
jgi:hypothetical protein